VDCSETPISLHLTGRESTDDNLREYQRSNVDRGGKLDISALQGGETVSSNQRKARKIWPGKRGQIGWEKGGEPSANPRARAVPGLEKKRRGRREKSGSGKGLPAVGLAFRGKRRVCEKGGEGEGSSVEWRDSN